MVELVWRLERRRLEKLRTKQEVGTVTNRPGESWSVSIAWSTSDGASRNQLYEAGSRPRGQRDYKGKCSDIATHFPFAYGGMSIVQIVQIVDYSNTRIKS